jgi:cytochrome c
MRPHLSPLRSRLPLLALLALCAAAGACDRSKPERVARATEETGTPDPTRFTKTVLVDGLDEPFQLEFDRRGRVYWIERSSGNVKRLDESTGEVTLLGRIPTTVVAEGGLMGILQARDFETSRRIYFYYSFVDGETRESRLSRFTLGADDRLDPASEKVLLRWPIDTRGHMGGGMTWDAQGNLYLATGDNSEATQYAPLRFSEPGGKGQDGMRTAANTNDLRGKILRIHPEPDGSYTIPAGNLFPPGTARTRPEIYTMGDRNPWRLSIDSRTGYLHWGEIGPDAGQDSAGVGPMGYDELNVARGPGNYGWPMFIGYNRPYNRYDYATGRNAEPFDPRHPVNPSPNDTGLRELPPARPALLAYPYGVSQEYPLLGSGGRAAVGGPVYHRADRPEAARPWPAYFEGKWLVVDFVRNWVMAITTDESAAKVTSIERVLPSITYLNPLDMAFGPNGDLYFVEYGAAPNGKISKVSFNAGNRAPRVAIRPSATAGATPLRVTLSSRGTVDYDRDELEYDWRVTPAAGGEARHYETPEAAVTFDRPGEYRVTLTATDPSGASDSASVRIVAGNEPPRVALQVVRGNRTFYFPGASIAYRTVVSDREDGAVRPQEVAVIGEFVPSGLTPAQAQRARALPPEESARNLQALEIVARSDCRGCPSEEAKLVGPAFRAVADRYRGDTTAVQRLAHKIVTGGSGVWGTVAMPPHPGLTPAEATTLAEYVLSVGATDAAPRRLPLQGTFTTPAPNGTGGTNPVRVEQSGSYLLRASYTDHGANGVEPITATDAILLRQPRLAPQDADTASEGTSYAPSVGDPMFTVNRSGAYIGYRWVDLTGIDSISVGVLTRFYAWTHFVGGTVELRLDSPTGRLLAPPIRVTPPAAPRPNPPPPPAQGGTGGAAQAPPAPENPTAPVYLGENLEKPISFPVGGATGLHDLYVVFRNESAGEAASLFLVTGVEFRRAEGAR